MPSYTLQKTEVSMLPRANRAATGPLPRIATTSEPAGPEETFEVMNRYGNVIATAGTEELARQDVRYRIANLGQTGVWVRKRVVTYETIYKPRLVRVLPRDLDADLATQRMEKLP